jgi:hypothetical protein
MDPRRLGRTDCCGCKEVERSKGEDVSAGRDVEYEGGI